VCMCVCVCVCACVCVCVCVRVRVRVHVQRARAYRDARRESCVGTARTITRTQEARHAMYLEHRSDEVKNKKCSGYHPPLSRYKRARCHGDGHDLVVPEDTSCAVEHEWKG
jgi:hypothetical protein